MGELIGIRSEPRAAPSVSLGFCFVCLDIPSLLIRAMAAPCSARIVRPGASIAGSFAENTPATSAERSERDLRLGLITSASHIAYRHFRVPRPVHRDEPRMVGQAHILCLTCGCWPPCWRFTRIATSSLSSLSSLQPGAGRT
jgi:hypothetical protein